MIAKKRPTQDLLENKWPNDRYTCDSGEGVGTRWIDERIDENHFLNEVGMLGGERQRHCPPKAVTAQGQSDETEGRREVNERLREGVKVVRVATRRGFLTLSEAGQIRRNDMEAAGQLSQDVVPSEPARKAIVHEHERGSAARLDESDARTPRSDVARDGLQGVTTLRHVSACLGNIGSVHDPRQG